MFCKCGCSIKMPENTSEQIICRRCSKQLNFDPNMKTFEYKEFKHNNKHSKDSKMIFNKNDRVKSLNLIKEECIKCGNNEMSFYTLQTRGADEGQTVFYECTKCHHKVTMNS